MSYCDIAIPLRLKTLTYYYDREDDLTGFAVTVSLKNKLYEGIVINRREQKPEGVEDIKKVESLLGRAYSKIYIEFLRWMSFYYIAEIGTILRLAFFDEIVFYLKGKKKRKLSYSYVDTVKDVNFLESLSLNPETVSKILDAFDKKEYKTFLIHSPSVPYEMKLMIEVTTKASSDDPVLLILPEIKEVKIVYKILKDKIGDSVVILHSEMKPSERYLTIEKIMQGNVKVIVGTRFAIFAPAQKLSLIMISQESSWLYKAEESPRYHARDCAVMRGFLERCPVVICDTLPSITSFWNSMKGKYEFIDDFSKSPHPKLRILKQPFVNTFNPHIIHILKLYEKDGVLVVTPRTGFSFLRCSECGEVLRCKKCGYSLIFHKETKSVECYRCDQKEKASESCQFCGGVNIHPIGTGIEKLKEELEKIFSKKGVAVKYYEFEDEQSQSVYILYAGRIKKTLLPPFKYAVFVDFDFFLSIPDYRALENAFGKILALSYLVRNDGVIYIQTRYPDSPFFKFLKFYNFRDFYLYELEHRKEAMFPPFVRFIKINVKLKKTASKDIEEKIKSFLIFHINAEIMGSLKGEKSDEFFFILRSKNKRKLTEELNLCINKLKELKGISLKIEVDPVTLRG
jgi:primosomal protein N' (replication factor Y)